MDGLCTVSVVVTNYNYAKFLLRCLRSLVEQSFPAEKFEVIVVDDGSVDGSIDLLNSVRMSNLRIVQLVENVGLADAANIGIRSALGRYLVRVDADDYVHPEFLRTLVTTMEIFESEFDAVACDYVVVDEQGHKASNFSSIEHPIACGVMFKADSLISIGAYKAGLRIGEDVDLMSRFLESGGKPFNLPLPLYRYVRHPGSLTSDQTGEPV